MSAAASSNSPEVVLSAHARYLRQLTERSGGRVVDDSGVVACVAVSDFPFLINAVFRTDPSVSAERVFAVGRAAFGPDRGFEAPVLPGRDDDVIAAGIAQGFHAPEGGSPLQAIGRRVEEPALPGDVDLTWVGDASGVADIAAITEIAHQVYGFPKGLFLTLFSQPESALAPNIRAVVAWRDGAPVATAQIHIAEAVAYVGWVAVLPEAERGGLGTLVTSRVTNAGLEAGARCSVLMASPMGAPVYRRMGYADVGELRSVLVPPGRTGSDHGA